MAEHQHVWHENGPVGSDYHEIVCDCGETRWV
jgi:hypothetical protein